MNTLSKILLSALFVSAFSLSTAEAKENHMDRKHHDKAAEKRDDRRNDRHGQEKTDRETNKETRRDKLPGGSGE